MIPKTTVNRFAYQSKTDLHVAQQDVVLLFALDLLHQRGLLPGLAFKGGTYLRKMILGKDGRFSEDLDFTAIDAPADPAATLTAAFKEPHHGVRFVLDGPGYTANNFRTNVKYAHDWDEGVFTIEISYRERPFLSPELRSPLDQSYFKELPFGPPAFPCLRLEEALAEKLRATQQRASERDVYDVIQYGRRAIPEDTVRLLAVAKLWSARERFDPDLLLGRLGGPRRDWPDLRRLLGRKDKTDWNLEAANAAERFAFLRDLTPFEKDLNDDVRRHALEGGLRHALNPA